MSRPSPLIDLFRAPELGNTTYLVSDPASGVAVAVDPLRDVGRYLDRAEELGVRVTRALETHVHNDFVSGSRELAAEVGASIGAAEDSGLEFPFVPLTQGAETRVGRWRLRARRRPGHTRPPELRPRWRGRRAAGPLLRRGAHGRRHRPHRRFEVAKRQIARGGQTGFGLAKASPMLGAVWFVLVARESGRVRPGG